jgi:hypothetical protein
MAALTPPDWIPPKLDGILSPLWRWYKDTLVKHGPFDVAIGTGDATDGEGKKERLGVLVPDVMEQADMAAQVYDKVAKKIFMVRGTPFHTSGTCEYEDAAADAIGASIADEQFLDLNGVLIAVRHALGRSDTAYGQGTPLFKESMRDLSQAIEADASPAELVIRGHVHYSAEVKIGSRAAISAPCLQFPDSVYGRTCKSFVYHMGLGVLDIWRKGDWRYRSILFPYSIVRKREYTCLTA